MVQFGNDCVDAEREARRVAEQQGSIYISPYNDWQVMAGQGTIAVELLQQMSQGKIDVCIVPVGGGGLIGGIAAVLKAAYPGCIVVGAQPAASDVMRQSVQAGKVVDVPSCETLSDATAGEPAAAYAAHMHICVARTSSVHSICVDECLACASTASCTLRCSGGHDCRANCSALEYLSAWILNMWATDTTILQNPSRFKPPMHVPVVLCVCQVALRRVQSPCSPASSTLTSGARSARQR